MCCFSGPVDNVTQTRIFARRAENGRQLLAYQMRYEARRPVAMILPLPVARYDEEIGATVRFIDLKAYPRFFPDLERAFSVPRAAHQSEADQPLPGGYGGFLPVENVGDFVASYVPTIAQFKRLDKRFTLPPRVWDKIPIYRDYGFAVFQLESASDGRSVHPMAFSFTSRYMDKLFFPTVHIHDGQIYPTDDFDHDLYWQPQRARRGLGLFASRSAVPANAEYVRQSEGSLGNFVDMVRAKNLVDWGRNAVKARLSGNLENRDIFISDSA